MLTLYAILLIHAGCEDEVRILEGTGNEKVNAFYEAFLSDEKKKEMESLKGKAAEEVLCQFVQDKYKGKKYFCRKKMKKSKSSSSSSSSPPSSDNKTAQCEKSSAVAQDDSGKISREALGYGDDDEDDNDDDDNEIPNAADLGYGDEWAANDFNVAQALARRAVGGNMPPSRRGTNGRMSMGHGIRRGSVSGRRGSVGPDAGPAGNMERRNVKVESRRRSSVCGSEPPPLERRRRNVSDDRRASLGGASAHRRGSVSGSSRRGSVGGSSRSGRTRAKSSHTRGALDMPDESQRTDREEDDLLLSVMVAVQDTSRRPVDRKKKRSSKTEKPTRRSMSRDRNEEVPDYAWDSPNGADNEEQQPVRRSRSKDNPRENGERSSHRRSTSRDSAGSVDDEEKPLRRRGSRRTLVDQDRSKCSRNLDSVKSKSSRTLDKSARSKSSRSVDKSEQSTGKSKTSSSRREKASDEIAMSKAKSSESLKSLRRSKSYDRDQRDRSSFTRNEQFCSQKKPLRKTRSASKEPTPDSDSSSEFGSKKRSSTNILMDTERTRSALMELICYSTIAA